MKRQFINTFSGLVGLCAALLLSSSVAFGAVTYSVKNYGARGNGTANDTAAIKACIDAVANAGGGSAYFPTGTYKIFKGTGSSDPIIPLRSGVTLAGDGQTKSFLKLADNQGDFNSLIGPASYYTPLNNVGLSNLAFNLSSGTNPISSANQLLQYGLRLTFVTHGGTNVSVSGCRFYNVANGQVLSMIDGEAGITTGVNINNNKFDLVGGGTVDYDHSTIYTENSQATITNNTFSSKNGVGTLGATTAIEIHGSNQTVTGNTVNGYAIGSIVTGIMPNGSPSRTQLYQSNTFNNVSQGFRIWTEVKNGTPNPALRDVTIKQNNILVNVDGWYNVPTGGGGVQNSLGNAGVLYANPTGGADNIRIEGNSITFTNFTTNTGRAYEYYNCGIRFSDNGYAPTQTNLNIIGNTINDAPGNAIYLEWPLNGADVSFNIINRPGRGYNLTDPNKYAMLVNGTVYAVRVHDNQFNDNQAMPTIKGGIYEEGNCQGLCYYYNNTFSTGSAQVPMFTQGPYHYGSSWIPAAP